MIILVQIFFAIFILVFSRSKDFNRVNIVRVVPSANAKKRCIEIDISPRDEMNSNSNGTLKTRRATLATQNRGQA